MPTFFLAPCRECKLCTAADQCTNSFETVHSLRRFFMLSPTALSHQSCNDTSSLALSLGLSFWCSLFLSFFLWHSLLILSPSLSTQRSSKPILLVKVYSIVAFVFGSQCQAGPFFKIWCAQVLCLEFYGVGILYREWTVGVDTTRRTSIPSKRGGGGGVVIGWAKYIHSQHWPSRGCHAGIHTLHDGSWSLFFSGGHFSYLPSAESFCLPQSTPNYSFGRIETWLT